MQSSRNLQDQWYLQASVKASVLTQIFSNMSKQLKQTESFYICFNSRQLKIGVKQQSQTIQIQLNLHYKIFSEYQYSGDKNEVNYIINKYSLYNFQFFDTFFETCKNQIKIKISDNMILFTVENGKTNFIAKRLFISQQQYEDLIQSGFGPSQENSQQKQHNQLRILKIRFFEEIIHTSCAFKQDFIQIWYKNNYLNFKINEKVNKKLKVEQVKIQAEIKRAKYPVKKMKLATSLLQSEKQVILSLYDGYLVFKYEQDNKKFYQIKICSISQTINQGF